MKNVVNEMFQKMIENSSTLRITKQVFGYSKYRGYFPKKISSNIKELIDVFKKASRPYNFDDMTRFLNGQQNTLQIDNGYYKWQISV